MTHIYLVGVRSGAKILYIDKVFQDEEKAKSHFFKIRHEMVQSLEEQCLVENAEGNVRMAQIAYSMINNLKLSVPDHINRDLTEYPFVKKMRVE